MADESSHGHAHQADDGDQVTEKDTIQTETNVESAELTGLSLILVTAGIGTTIFLMSLDTSIISTAIPRITSQFNSTGDIGWYGSAYSFAMCALQPIMGRLFTSFSMKVRRIFPKQYYQGLRLIHVQTTFLVCFMVFELGSLICAVSVNSPMLIVGRAIAGSGAAGCFTGGFSIVAACLPLEKRPFYIGILQSTFGIATIIGPLLGGVFTERTTWRWCFWMNLPFGAVVIPTLIFFFKPPRHPESSKPSVLRRLAHIDFVGALLFIPAIIMILLALDRGGSELPWKSATVIGLFLGGAGAGLLFVVWQVRMRDNALIPPRIFTQRTMFLACLTEFFAMGAVYMSIYYLPEWFQVVKDASPTRSGLMYLPLALSDVLSATLTGLALKYLGYPNAFLLLGTALMCIATGLFSTFTVTTSHTHWIPYQVLQGLGVGMTLSMPYVATQAVLKPADIPIGTSLIQCTQFLGAAIWLVVGNTIFESKLIAHLTSSDFDEQEINAVLAAGSADARNVVSHDRGSAVVDAYNYGITKAFYIAVTVAGAAFLVSLGIQWKSMKPSRAGNPSETELGMTSTGEKAV